MAEANKTMPMQYVTPEMLARVAAHLEARIKTLEETLAKSKGLASTREMTDEDAKRVFIGDLKDVPHKKAAETLGLSYGQVYSARLEYTFKHVLKACKADGWKNPWVK